MINHFLKVLLLCLAFVVQTGFADNPSKDDSITMVGITKAQIKATIKNEAGNFLNWHIIGACFWVQWTPFGPDFSTTWKIDQFVPDSLVTVFTGYGQDRLWFAKHLHDKALHLAGKTLSGDSDSGNQGASANAGSVKFKEVEVFGNPAANAIKGVVFASLTANTMPYAVYYSSLLDVDQWRNATMDILTHPQDLLPGVRNEGTLTDDWGGIYPRDGFIRQPGDFKAGAVLALRGADIATTGGAHVATPMGSGEDACGSHCKVWASHENDFNDVKFQEVYPEIKTDAQKIFGINDPLTSTVGQNQFTEGDGNYVFILWRHYRGCIQGAGDWIGET